jgi:phosphoribosylaminoimidazole-succinocarboxamide synthase
VLNQTAAWWFANTRHIIDNAVLDVPDPNITVMKKCSVFPVEFVVRGFMTGRFVLQGDAYAGFLMHSNDM